MDYIHLSLIENSNFLSLTISRLVISLILFYLGYLTWTKDVNLLKWGQKKLQNTLPINENKYSDKDIIIAEKYYNSSNLFIAKFRITLHCLIPSNSIPPQINDVFQPGRNMLKATPNISKMDEALMNKIFTEYDLSKPAINFTPHPNTKHPTSLDMLVNELIILHKSCDDILTKYASSGNASLIKDIEIMKNRTENLIGPFGIRNPQVSPQKNKEALVELFMLIKKSLSLTKNIKEQKNQ